MDPIRLLRAYLGLHRTGAASQGHGIYACARLLGVSPSTLYRERRRNRCEDGRYRVEKADRRARSRQRISRRNHRLEIWQIGLIRQFLALYWSPVQIS